MRRGRGRESLDHDTFKKLRRKEKREGVLAHRGDICYGSTVVGVFFEAEGLGGVACGLEEGFEMEVTKDIGKRGLVSRNPVWRRQGPGGFVSTFAWDIFLLGDYDQTGEQTLEDVEDVTDWLNVVAEGGECRTVKDHLPLDSTLRRKEGRGVFWNFDAHGWGPREAVGRLERTGTFDGEEHTRVSGDDIVPTVFVDELGLGEEQPPVSADVGGTESFCSGERDAGP